MIPADLGIKGFPSFYPWQEPVIEQITSGKQVFLLDAPTGSGKSLIAVASFLNWGILRSSLNRMTGETEEAPYKAIYITQTKQLQTQLAGDFGFARVIKGRSNFPCRRIESGLFKGLARSVGLTAADCTHNKEKPCPYKSAGCYYESAKTDALKTPMAIMNYAYFLAELNGPGYFSGRSFVILDEVDGVASALMSHISLDISEAMMAKYGLILPGVTCGCANKKEGQCYNPSCWFLSVNSWFAQLIAEEDRLEPKAERDAEALKELGAVRRTREKLNSISFDLLQTNFNDWIITKDVRPKSTVWSFKPITVTSYLAKKHLWRHLPGRTLGMSATILKPDLLEEEIRIPYAYDYEKIPSPFKKENRPVYYRPVVNLTSKTMKDELPVLASEVAVYLRQHPNVKTLVHTTSYPIRNYLMRYLVEEEGFKEWMPGQGIPRIVKSARLITHEQENREDVLAWFKGSVIPLVLLSPSMIRGADLPDDQCRLILICKVPFPYMGDAQTAARMKLPGGNLWYAITTLQSVIQMTGRGVRHQNDWCDTYILDRQWDRLKRQTGWWIPNWFRMALK